MNTTTPSTNQTDDTFGSTLHQKSDLPKITEIPEGNNVKIIVEFRLEDYGFNNILNFTDKMLHIYAQKKKEYEEQGVTPKFYLVAIAYGMPKGNDAFQQIQNLITTEKKNEFKTAKWDSLVFYYGDEVGGKIIEAAAYAMNKVSNRELTAASRMKVFVNYKGTFDPSKIEEYYKE